MCGIVGYTGKGEATPVLLAGLESLEYRGYDSAGIAVYGESLVCRKSRGKLEKLKTMLSRGESIKGNCGIGHTRWATHGKPNERNAHPQLSNNLALVHNGIIENYIPLREMLSAEGYVFKSETDTEAAAHLIDFYYEKSQNPLEAITAAIKNIKGSFAFCIIFKNEGNTIWAVHSGSPLLCARSKDGTYLSSDITALLPYTKEYYETDENTVIKATSSGVEFYSLSGEEKHLKPYIANWSAPSAKKQGYNHFMQKEIYEQPNALKNTVNSLLKDGMPHFGCDVLDREKISFSEIKIIACGTAMHAGLIGKNLIENLARISVSVETASEFRYGNPILKKDTLIIAVSQSGETADTLAALELARNKGCKTVAVINAIGSSMSRSADYVIYTDAGPEISVASTKAYTVQCAVFYLLAFKLAFMNGKITAGECRSLSAALTDELLEAVEKTLLLGGKIKRIGEKLADCKDVFFIGRGVDALVCMEGSLKLKEISYIHSEACPAGELKHGTISLIEKGTPVIALTTQRKIAQKTASNVRETKTRGARVISFCSPECAPLVETISNHTLMLPQVGELFYPVVAAVVFQLLAYYTAVRLGNDVDKPRNLAKSVTVE